MRSTTARIAIGIGIIASVGTMSACSSSGGTDASSPAGTSAPAQSTSAATSESTSAAAPSSTETTDYSNLLISASDIPVPGFKEGTPAAPPQGNGVTVAFTGDSNRTLGDTIIVLDSAAQATSAAAASVAAAKQAVSSPEVTSAPIGDGGTAIRGTASSQEVAVLVWHTGRAMIVLQFQSPSGDLVPTSVIQAVATKQQALVAAGVPA